MNKSLCVLLAAGGLWVNSSFAETPAEVRVAYSGGSQVLMLAKADGSLDKALNSKVKWVQFASGADALNYFASNAIDIANFGSSPATAGIVRKLPVEIIGVSGVIASYERLIGKDGIASIKDIEGKRVAYPPNSTAQYALEAAISVNHLDRSKITLLPLRPAKWSQPGNAVISTRAMSGRRLLRNWRLLAGIRCSQPKICKKMVT